MSKLFVWDFHGVLEKDTEFAAVEYSNLALESLGYSERFDIAFARKFYGLPWHLYFKNLISHLDEDKCYELQRKCYEIQENDFSIVKKHIKPNDFVHDVLNSIRSAGFKQILISNTNEESLTNFTDSINVTEFFEEIIAADRHNQGIRKNKNDFFAEFLEDKDFTEIIIIGDSEGDMKLKEVKGGKTYFYSHPHVKRKGIVADKKIEDLREVLIEIK